MTRLPRFRRVTMYRSYALDWRPSPDALPRTLETSRWVDAAGALAGFLFVTALCGFPLWFAWRTSRAPQDLAGLVSIARAFLSEGGVVAAFFCGLGLVWLASAYLFFVTAFLFRERIVLTREAVEFERRGLFGTERWREPIASYEGVAAGPYLVEPDTDSARSVTGWAVALRHRDPAKTVPLAIEWPAASKRGWRGWWTEYGELTAEDLAAAREAASSAARALGLRVLEPDELDGLS